MTDQTPNCSNCSLFIDNDCTVIGKWLTSDEYNMTNRVGCLSHPDARAYLMRDVIEELERREKIFGGDYGVAYRAAILLIKGVKE